MPDIQEQRRKAFAALLEADGSSPTDYDEGEEEDPRPYLSGEEPIGRYCVVTLNWSSHGSEKLFYLPSFNDLMLATNRAEEYDRDDIFEELPVKVVDFDTGDEYYAEPVYTWKIKTKSTASLHPGDWAQKGEI
jgi:hypothetical protein